MVFACKKCKKVFRKNLKDFEETDEYCPGCDNHYYIKASCGSTSFTSLPGAAMVVLEGGAGASDDRMKQSKGLTVSQIKPGILTEVDQNQMGL